MSEVSQEIATKRLKMHKPYIVRNYRIIRLPFRHCSLRRAPKTLCILKQAVQGHPRSSILVPIESAYATSY